MREEQVEEGAQEEQEKEERERLGDRDEWWRDWDMRDSVICKEEGVEWWSGKCLLTYAVRTSTASNK